MDKSLEKTIQRIKRFSLTCTLNDNGTTRYFHNGHEYIEIGGIKWATCNVGAEKPIDSGLYFQWGGIEGFTAEQVKNGEKRFVWGDYKYGTRNNLTKYNRSDKKTTLEPQDDAATFNMGIGWRTPTREEFKTLVDSTTSKWITNYKGNGVSGRLFTDKKDKTKTLFFPAASWASGSVYDVGHNGHYWSSSLYTGYPQSAFRLYFYDEDISWDYGSYRCYGFTVRGVVG